MLMEFDHLRFLRRAITIAQRATKGGFGYAESSFGHLWLSANLICTEYVGWTHFLSTPNWTHFVAETAKKCHQSQTSVLALDSLACVWVEFPLLDRARMIW